MPFDLKRASSLSTPTLSKSKFQMFGMDCFTELLESDVLNCYTTKLAHVPLF